MNVWGKVFAFLVVISAIVASILTAKLVQTRNSWTSKTLASKAKTEDLKPKIAALEIQIESLKNEIYRSQLLWGNFWPSVPTTVNPGNGMVQVTIGSDVGVRPNLYLHGFEIAADGTSIYRGSFSPVDIQKDVSTLKPNWRLNPNEARSWSQQANWRWRNLVPSGYEENFDKQLTSILKLEETLNDRLRTLKGEEDLLVDAKAKLKLREAELVGWDELTKGDNVDAEHRDGLVAAIIQAEENRNQTLLKVDEQRRTLRGVQADIERLHSENLELMSRLPQATSKGEITRTTLKK